MRVSAKPANILIRWIKALIYAETTFDRNIFPDCLKTSIQRHDQQKTALLGKNVQINNIEDALVIQRLGNHY